MTTETLIHPTAEQLLSYHDGEMPAPDASKVHVHLVSCESCCERIDQFERTSATLAAWLETLAAPEAVPPDARPASRAPVSGDPRAKVPWYRRPSLRAALLMIGLGTATLMVAPVRGWVVEIVRTLVSPESGVPVDRPPAPQEVPTSSVVSFLPTSDLLSVEIATVQREGVLSITPTDARQVSGQVTGTGVASLMVTGNGIRILNEDISTASYVVSVPATVRRIVVRIAGRVSLTTSRQALLETRGATLVLPSGDIRRDGTNR